MYWAREFVIFGSESKASIVLRIGDTAVQDRTLRGGGGGRGQGELPPDIL